MDELVARLSSAAGIDAAKATAAVKAILVFLDREAPADAVGELVRSLPGAEAALADAKASQDGESGFGGFGAMAAYHALTAVGLSGSEVQVVTKELLAHARETVGEETVGRIVGSIPGLEAFI
ncbi:hypothetical protein ACFQ4O_12885 [Methylopila musalis]|uniref:DUF2267 domain-containing protein n=1 Tax=Methylopila musalis TaxID=1134781 RepID=A0ABW3Z9J8_9HYPH